MRILIVDDDRAVRDALRRALTLGGYETETAGGGREALERLAANGADAVVLDIGMPDVDGMEVCRRLRSAGNRVPILMVTARDAIDDRIGGLDAGADDYLVKPFDVGELKARLRALLRRVGEFAADADGAGAGNGHGGAAGASAVGDVSSATGVLTFGPLRLDPDRHGVATDDGFAELTRTEYQLLELLMRNPRRVLPHSVIYDRVWGYDFGPASNALRVYVGYLRRKLETAGAVDYIHTVRGVGYVLREP